MCQIIPNLPWCDNNNGSGKSKKEKPNSVWTEPKTNLNPENPGSIFGWGSYNRNKYSDKLNNWINGQHPYLNNARNNMNNFGNWINGPHPYLGPVGLGLGILGIGAAIYFSGGTAAPALIPLLL